MDFKKTMNEMYASLKADRNTNLLKIAKDGGFNDLEIITLMISNAILVNNKTIIASL